VTKATMKATTAGVNEGTEDVGETDDREEGQCKDDDQGEGCRRGQGRG
jgi:hypothetical protein